MKVRFWIVAVLLSRRFLVDFPQVSAGNLAGPSRNLALRLIANPAIFFSTLNSHAHALLGVVVHRSVRNLFFVSGPSVIIFCAGFP